jgi:glycoprotein-N-acetylgalactosamine 3-beta-galactosyltransferase
MKYRAIFINDLDEKNQKRFFPFKFEIYTTKEVTEDYDWNYPWKNTSQGSLDCCSDTFVHMHYVTPTEMNQLEYFVYHVHPFGIEKNLTESLPRKFSLEEIIKTSDEKSLSRNYIEHVKHHQLDDDEKY